MEATVGGLSSFVLLELLLLDLHELTYQCGHLVGCGIEREMARIENVDFCLGYIFSVAFWFTGIERKIVLAPDHQQTRLLLAHPRLPFRISFHICSVVIEQVALNIGLAGLIEKVEFISPEIGVIAFHLRIVPDMTRPRRLKREEICAKCSFVRR